jgi:hypothetical protein
VRFAALDKAVRLSSPCIRGTLGGPISEEVWRKRRSCGGFTNNLDAVGRPSSQENRCRHCSEEVTSDGGRDADAPEGVHLGKIGSEMQGLFLGDTA